MNIKDLKTLVANLPVEIDAAQLALIEQDVEELLAEQRKIDEAELEAITAKAAKLREKLGLNASVVPTAPTPASRLVQVTRSEIDETDAGMGVREPREEGGNAESFRDELAALRERTQEKRRRLS